MEHYAQEALQHKFTTALHEYNCPQGVVDDAFAAIVAHYNEPTRLYHTLNHVDHVVRTIELYYPDAPAWIVLAAFYHDVIYDPTSHTNERDSADFASATLAGYLPESAIININRAILVTAGHVLETTDHQDYPLLVADLASLACDKDVYRTNTVNIRQEYAAVNDQDWSAGRLSFIESFAARRIFPREPRYDALERAAHENMRRELLLYRAPPQ
jgi:predicted metal-dependent HD superfamily phosphohydrolase